MKKSSAILSTIIIIILVVNFIFPFKGPYADISLENAILNTYPDINKGNVNPIGNLPDKIKDNNNTDISAFPSEGYYSGEQKILINDKNSGEVFYTLDGTTPTESSTPYSGEITLSESTEINAVSIKDGVVSKVSTFDYVILTDKMSYVYGYGYNSLNKTQQEIYREIYDCVSNFEGDITFPHNISEVEATRLYWCVNYDNPLLFHLPYDYSWYCDDNYVYGMTMNFTYTKYEVEDYAKRVRNKTDDILAKANGSKSLMDYLVVIHDEVLNNSVYKESIDDAYRAFGVLVKGEGVCESYSRAFAYICRRIGLENLIVVGNSFNEGHMWNMINIQGDWYHFDLTWDENDDGKIYYDYFNLTDKQILSDGRDISPEISEYNYDTLDYNFYPIPEATNETFNYFKYYNKKAPDYDSWGGDWIDKWFANEAAA